MCVCRYVCGYARQESHQYGVAFCPTGLIVDRPMAWLANPVFPSNKSEQPVLARHNDRFTLCPSRCFLIKKPTLARLAELVDRAADSVLLIALSGNLLNDVSVRGIEPKRVLAVPPSPFPGTQWRIYPSLKVLLTMSVFCWHCAGFVHFWTCQVLPLLHNNIVPA